AGAGPDLLELLEVGVGRGGGAGARRVALGALAPAAAATATATGLVLGILVEQLGARVQVDHVVEFGRLDLGVRPGRGRCGGLLEGVEAPRPLPAWDVARLAGAAVGPGPLARRLRLGLAAWALGLAFTVAISIPIAFTLAAPGPASGAGRRGLGGRRG